MADGMKVERDWHSHGLRCIAVATDMGHRCGYVVLPRGHHLHGIGYDESPLGVLDVHGGLTYAKDGLQHVESSGEWFLGFDCCHGGDATDPTIMSEAYRRAEQEWPKVGDCVIRTLDYVVSECESLAKQIGELVEQKPAEVTP